MKKHFSDTRKNILKLNGLLESLFFLSRIEEHEGDLEKKELALYDFLDSKVQAISESFPDKTLSYTLDIPKNLTYSVEKNTF